VDAMAVYAPNQPHQTAERNIPVTLISPRNYGVASYGATLFTLESRVYKTPDAVRLFREATIQGWRYALQHPEEIVDLILEHYPTGLSRAELLREAEATAQLVGDLEDMGRMNPGRWLAMAEAFAGLAMAPENYDLKGFFYNPNALFEVTQLRRLLWGLAIVC